MMQLSGAEIIIKMLENFGIKIIAGIPGGSNLPLYSALANSNIKHILTRHEQGAGFLAQGMARSTGKPAVCFATSGPGSTNLVTAIADAKADSVPIIGITGQVPTSMIGLDAFQEVDTYGMTLPITKHNFLVRSTEDLPFIIPEAFRIATSGRPGPIIIDIPKDIQAKKIEIEKLPESYQSDSSPEINLSTLEEIAEMINNSEKPVIYAGGGIINSNAHNKLYSFAEKNSIPTSLTLMGLGGFPPDSPLYLGMLGMHGLPYTNIILHEADLLLAFGVRFDDRATGNIRKFCPNAKIIHVDIDSSEINKIKKANISITGDIGEALEKLIPMIEENPRYEWIAQINRIKAENPYDYPEPYDIFHPVNFILNLSKMVSEDTIITTDVGQHQMWTAQLFSFTQPRTFLTSGGLGTMGFGLPAAIGVALANPDKQIITISGDGSILMNIQELATLAEHDLNVKIFIMNNGHLGLVRQQQELFYNQTYIASKFISEIDFAGIARSFGIKGIDLKNSENPLETIAGCLSETEPCLISVPINAEENVMPMVPPGAGNLEMLNGIKK